MSEQQDLTPIMQEMMAQMKGELDSLKERARLLPRPEQPDNLIVSTTRRKVLRRLAGGMLAGLAVSGVVAMPEHVEAKLVVSPPDQSGRIGAIVSPSGIGSAGTLVDGAFKYGLVALSGPNNFDLSNFFVLPQVNTAVVAVGQDTGVYGTGSTHGVRGQSFNNIGVFGSGPAIGVHGYNTSTDGVGVKGEATGLDHSIGVHGYNTSAAGIGVKGEATGSGVTFGVYATGVYGFGSGSGSTGVYGEGQRYAGFFNGELHSSGAITGATKAFKIDHPLDPANRYLYHTSIESPDMLNLYNGVVKLDGQGFAEVEMPAYFEALNTDLRYQLTALGAASPNLHIAAEMKDCKFKIGGGQPGQRASWQVTGFRQDAWAKAHRIPVEEDKSGKEKGKYLHPEVFGQPKEMSVHPRSVAAK